MPLGVVAAVRRHKLTRESILDGSHHARIRAAYGPDYRFMSDVERKNHIDGMLARAPRAGRRGGNPTSFPPERKVP